MDSIIAVKVAFSHNLNVVFSFMQSVLGELDWKIIKIKVNSIFHGFSLIFHTFKSILSIISGNIDCTIKVK